MILLNLLSILMLIIYGFVTLVEKMDLLIIFCAFMLLLGGILGSFLPILPGVPLSWLGLLVFHFAEMVPMNYSFLAVTLVISLIIFALQYIIPAMGTKYLGGSKWGMWGATIGLVLGLFLPIPMAIFVVPFLGAFVGEILNKSNSRTALKAASGSFLGLIASTFMEFLVSVSFLIIFFIKLWSFREQIFGF